MGMSLPVKRSQISIGRLEWRLTIMTNVHNHSIAVYLEGQSYIGRLSESESSTIIEMSKCHVWPKNILTSLKLENPKNPKNVLTMKTIYNAQYNHRVNEQGGKMKMQHLLFKITEYKYIEWYRSNDQTKSIMDLFLLILMVLNFYWHF